MGLGDTYGCAKSTCCGIVLDFCKAIVKSGFRNMYIRWPSPSWLATLTQYFEVARGIPFVVGAIDGSHIPIIAPRHNHVDYFNQKCFHSILLQFTVAANCSIWNYDVGWAGSGHVSLNFSRSNIGQACARGELDLVAACLVLHNICIQHGESFDMEWVRKAEAKLSVHYGCAEEAQRAVATSLRELQATREVDIEDAMERSQGGNERGASDLGLGLERRDSLAQKMWSSINWGVVQHLNGR
ncbi:hypothetical protein L7F22_000452 [Adiantum nelumboides]|nr:hypothetical protein [Adiantum nelumboides]